MPKCDFFFSYNIKTKSGKMKFSDKYIKLSGKKKASAPPLSSSGGLGYGINLLWEDKK